MAKKTKVKPKANKSKPAKPPTAKAKAKSAPAARTAKLAKTAKKPARAKSRITPYATDLDKTPANYVPLSPITFLERSARTFPDHVAVIHGDLRRTYTQFYQRTRKLASALTRRGIKKFDTVALLAPNIPAMLEAHYGVPMAGAVINTINYRLSPAEVAFILDHGEAKVFIVDREFGELAAQALQLCKAKPYVIGIDDGFDGGMLIGEIEYEAFIETGDADFVWSPPADEWDAIALN
ncbi:MAG TPA: hypothetical protein DCL48_01890, partial [Alphaproteobacteria bacterium]|nr:hypothetical protein [Alphaproteobacteria bacterium]